MEKIISIDGKEIPLKSNASILVSYRNNFAGDLIRDIVKMQSSLEKSDSGIDQIQNLDIDMFTKLLWCMAKASDNQIPPLEKWLEQFDMFSIIQAIPDVMELLTGNLKQTNEIKKK